MRLFPKKENARFTLSDPPLTVTRNFLSCKAKLRKLGVKYHNLGLDYFYFPGKLPGYDVDLMIGIHAFGFVVSYIEIFRTSEDWKRFGTIDESFREFSAALERLFGPPSFRTEPREDGSVHEEWEKPFRIVHYTMERFGMEEHLWIYHR